MGRKLIGIVASVGGGEVSEAGGGGPERKGGSSTSPPPNSTQRQPTPARLWWSLRPCQRVKQRLLPRNLFSASATPRQPVSPRQLSGPQSGAGSWHRPQYGAGTEPKNRSRAHHLAYAELVRTAFFWKLLVEDVGQSGWLSNRRAHFQEFLSLSSCSSV